MSYLLILLADVAGSISTLKPPDLQPLLESTNSLSRLKIALEILIKEKKTLEWEQSIREEVEKKIGDSQRTYFLREQLKHIKSELGVEKDQNEMMVEKFEKKYEMIKDNISHEETKNTIEEELIKFKTIEKQSPEFNVTKDYLGEIVDEMVDEMVVSEMVDEMVVSEMVDEMVDHI